MGLIGSISNLIVDRVHIHRILQVLLYLRVLHHVHRIVEFIHTVAVHLHVVHLIIVRG